MPRIERVEDAMMKELNQLIAYDMKDPRINGMISVTKVQTSKELKHAKVYISIFNNQNPELMLDVLQKASAFLRSELFKRLKIREIPELHFALDNSIEYGFKIDNILKEIHKSEE